MARIDKLEIKNFKFFDEVEPLDFESKNILLYGENGSGKSTIYWALYTLLQSSKKDDSKIKKYFTHTTTTIPNSSSLVNIYANEDDAKIEIFPNEMTDRLVISKNDITIKDTTLIEKSLYTSDFINYKYLFRFFNFLHQDKIDLFTLFEYEVLHLLQLNELWQEIVELEKPKPRVIKNKIAYKNLIDKLKQFNEQLKTKVLNLNEPTNRYLGKFDYHNMKIIITFIGGKYEKEIFDRPQINIELKVIKSDGNEEIILRPQSYFNEAKLTAIALSVRLAITEIKLKDSLLKLLVLDDLLVSLDMSNRDKVLDILLDDNILKEYQKIILTHDRGFFEMAKHKFDYIQKGEWKYFEMYVDSTGDFEKPFINKESLGYLEKADRYFRLHEYEIAGNFLRKEAEYLCKVFLSKKVESRFDLSNLIAESISIANNIGLDDTLFKKLDHHRQFVLNPRSHDNYEIPTYKSEIESALNTLKELRRIRNEPFLEKGKIVEFELSNGADTYTFEIQLKDDFRVFTIEGQSSVISKGKIIYWVKKNGAYTKDTKDESEAYDTTTLKKFYDKNYEKSDKSKSASFWDEIIVQQTGEKIKTITMNL